MAENPDIRSVRGYLWFEVFWVFLKIGVSTIGGGYAMLPHINRELVQKRRWFPADEFLDLLALAQSAPGAIAVNTAVIAGYRLRGFFGAFLAVFGAVLPSFLIIILIATVFLNFRQLSYVEAAFAGILPAVTALILVAGGKMARQAVTDKRTLWLLLGALVALLWLSIHPILVIIASGLIGAVFLREESKKRKSLE